MPPVPVLPKTILQLNAFIEMRLKGATINDATRRLGLNLREGTRYEDRWNQRKAALSAGPPVLSLRQARELIGATPGVAAALLDITLREVVDREDGVIGLPAGELDVYASSFGIPRDRLAAPARPAPDLADPVARGQLAERMTARASEFAELVRDENHTGIGRYLETVAAWEWPAFAIALAAQVDPDRPVTDALAWVTWTHTTRHDDVADDAQKRPWAVA